MPASPGADQRAITIATTSRAAQSATLRGRPVEGQGGPGLRPLAQSLDDDGGLVNTEYASQGSADLPEGDARLHGLEDGGQQVVPAAGRPVYGFECAPGRRGVARLA